MPLGQLAIFSIRQEALPIQDPPFPQCPFSNGTDAGQVDEGVSQHEDARRDVDYMLVSLRGRLVTRFEMALVRLVIRSHTDLSG